MYGQCVTANYENIERNMCQKEFLAFKACVQQKVSLISPSLLIMILISRERDVGLMNPYADVSHALILIFLLLSHRFLGRSPYLAQLGRKW